MITEDASRLPLCQLEGSYKSKDMCKISGFMDATHKMPFISVDFSLSGLACTKSLWSNEKHKLSLNITV